MKISIILGLSLCLVMGCATMKAPPPQEVIIKIHATEPTKIEVKNGDEVQKTMTIKNPEGSLSNLSFICRDVAFIKIFSALTVGDVTSMWNDICVLEYDTEIRKLHIFINSPGGDAFSGLALADQIESAKKKGFHVIGHASGIVASAAIPIFAVCHERLAASGTIFMVHETSLWKWPGRESASDIRAQNQLLDLLRDRYLNKLTKQTKLTKDEWAEIVSRTTWFSAEQAKEWGLVDRIE